MEYTLEHKVNGMAQRIYNGEDCFFSLSDNLGPVISVDSKGEMVEISIRISDTQVVKYEVKYRDR